MANDTKNKKQSVCKKSFDLQLKNDVTSLNDFDRFKVMVLRKKVIFIS